MTTLQFQAVIGLMFLFHLIQLTMLLDIQRRLIRLEMILERS